MCQHIFVKFWVVFCFISCGISDNVGEKHAIDEKYTNAVF